MNLVGTTKLLGGSSRVGWCLLLLCCCSSTLCVCAWSVAVHLLTPCRVSAEQVPCRRSMSRFWVRGVNTGTGCQAAAASWYATITVINQQSIQPAASVHYIVCVLILVHKSDRVLILVHKSTSFPHPTVGCHPCRACCSTVTVPAAACPGPHRTGVQQSRYPPAPAA